MSQHLVRGMSIESGRPPVFLTLDDAAASMSVSVKTIRRWIAAGILPAYRCGSRAIRVRLEDLDSAAKRVPCARWP